MENKKWNIGDIVYQKKDLSVRKIYKCNKFKQWFIRKFINKKFNIPYGVIDSITNSGFSVNHYYKDTIIIDEAKNE